MNSIEFQESNWSMKNPEIVFRNFFYYYLKSLHYHPGSKYFEAYLFHHATSLRLSWCHHWLRGRWWCMGWHLRWRWTGWGWRCRRPGWGPGCNRRCCSSSSWHIYFFLSGIWKCRNYYLFLQLKVVRAWIKLSLFPVNMCRLYEFWCKSTLSRILNLVQNSKENFVATCKW